MDSKKEKFLEALTRGRGIISTACEAMGISRSTFYRWVNSDPEFKLRVEDVTEIQVDFVESKLMQLIESGDTTAIIFYLKTKGRKRGYNEKVPIKEKPTTEAPAIVPKEDSDKIAKKINAKKAYIVKLLRKQGKYTAELTYQVDITARLLVRADILSDEIMADGHKTVNVEYSREGHERVTVNPKEKLYLDILEKGQRALRALGMNTESKERKTDEDSFENFANDFLNKDRDD